MTFDRVEDNEISKNKKKKTKTNKKKKGKKKSRRVAFSKDNIIRTAEKWQKKRKEKKLLGFRVRDAEKLLSHLTCPLSPYEAAVEPRRTRATGGGGGGGGREKMKKAARL